MRILIIAFIFLGTLQNSTAANGNETPSISLTVLPGTPLRVYLTKRVSKRLGARRGQTHRAGIRVRPRGGACRVSHHRKGERG
jgi:hypothetical protein